MVIKYVLIFMNDIEEKDVKKNQSINWIKQLISWKILENGLMMWFRSLT